MSKRLSVVLPVHNAEATLHHDVANVLEIAGELTNNLRLFIVDDGSTDDTYDIATELAAQFPQLRVMRHAVRQGLGSAIESLRLQVAGDMVLVHDGTSPIEAAQIRQLWLEQHSRKATSVDREVSIDDLRHAASMHAPMAAAHVRLTGFQSLPTIASDESQLTRRDETPRKGVGVIPPLPRPNIMGALTSFALGE